MEKGEVTFSGGPGGGKGSWVKDCSDLRRSSPGAGAQCLGSPGLDRRAEAGLWGAPRDIYRMLILFFPLINVCRI